MVRDEMHSQDQPGAARHIDRRLAFGLFAPPVAWFAHEVAGVAIVGRHCATADSLLGWQWVALTVLSLGAAAVAVAAAIGAYRVFRRHTRGGSVTEAEGWSRVEFLSLLGMFLSALLLLNIVYFGVMPFVVEPCVRTT